MVAAAPPPASRCEVCAGPAAPAVAEGHERRPSPPSSLCAPCAARRAARRRWEGANPPYGLRVVPRLEFAADAQSLLILEVRPHDRLTIRARVIDFSESGLGVRLPEPLVLGQEVIVVGQAVNVRRATASWRGRIQWVEPAQPGLWDAGLVRLETLHADLFVLLSQILVSVCPG